VQYGHVKKEAGRLGQAEEAYRKAIELDPNAADSYAQLGHALKMQGRGDEAADAYRKALALDAALCAALEPPDLVMPAALHPPQHYIKTMHGTYLCIDKATG
jgi:tetratricopeptide (TPR) repeat protein